MQRTFTILIAVVSWFAVIAQLLLMMHNQVASIPETIIRFFSFFTILTNTLVALFFTGRSLNLGFSYKAGALTAVTAYILMVSIVYQFLLRHQWHVNGLQLVVDELLHTINPLLVISYWYLCEKKGAVKYGQIKTWIIYPLVYCLYILLRGSLAGFYPYPFVDVSTIGLQRTLLNCGLLMVFFILVAILFVATGKKMAQKNHLPA